jgi:sulfur carrier protein
MRVKIRNPQRREIDVQGVKLVDQLLRKLDLNPESHLVVVNGELVTGDRHISEEDTVEIISAISGG